MSAGLQADGFMTKGHRNGIEVGLCLDYETQTGSHPLPQLSELPLQLRGSEIQRHAPHPLADPPHHAPPQFPPPQWVPILIKSTHAHRLILRLLLRPTLLPASHGRSRSKVTRINMICLNIFQKRGLLAAAASPPGTIASLNAAIGATPDKERGFRKGRIAGDGGGTEMEGEVARERGFHFKLKK